MAHNLVRPTRIATAVRPFEPLWVDEALYRIMEAANRTDDLGERGVRDKEAVMVGVDDVALDVVKYLTPLVVDPVDTRRAVKPPLLQMPQKGVNTGRPRASWPIDRVIDPHHHFVRVAA